MSIARRWVARVALGALCALSVALVAQYSLWGFVFHTPSLASLLGDQVDLRRASLVEISNGRIARELLEGDDVLKSEKWESVSAPYLYGFERLVGQATTLAKKRHLKLAAVDPELMNAIWTELRFHEEDWYRVEPPFRRTANNGWLVILDTSANGRRTVLAAHRTSEIANDRFAYQEAALEVSLGRLKWIGSAHYRFEVAGLEFLGLPTLLVLSGTVVLLVSLSLVFYGRWRRRATASRVQ